MDIQPITFYTNPFDWGSIFEQSHQDFCYFDDKVSESSFSSSGMWSPIDSDGIWSPVDSSDEDDSPWPFEFVSSRFVVGFNRPIGSGRSTPTVSDMKKPKQIPVVKVDRYHPLMMSAGVRQKAMFKPIFRPFEKLISIEGQVISARKRFPPSRKPKIQPKYH